jgi:hypothetical protein
MEDGLKYPLLVPAKLLAFIPSQFWAVALTLKRTSSKQIRKLRKSEFIERGKKQWEVATVNL